MFLFHDHSEFDNVEVTDPYDKKTYTIPERKGSLQQGLEFWEGSVKAGSLLIIHNAHSYDRVVINKVWPNNIIPLMLTTILTFNLSCSGLNVHALKVLNQHMD